jgi:hypothetical protein
LSEIRNRAKDMLPSMLLTLMSIIQALALEFLWDRVRVAEQALTWAAVLVWIQITANMLGILQVWLFYVSVAMRFRWVPTSNDLLLPFLIGILEFTMIDLTGSAHLPLWFATLATVYAIAAWDAQNVMARARRDGDNEEFFKHLRPATMRDLGGPVLAVGGLMLFGIAIYLTDENVWLTLAGLLFATGMLALQIAMGRYYWKRSMQET